MSVDLLYSDTEDALRDSVRQLFADRCPLEAVAKSYDSPPPDFSGVWRTLSTELGLAGLLVPESLGGAGATVREAAVVMEEIGRAVAPVPFLSSAVLATVALTVAGDTETLPALAAGEVTAALAVPLSTAPWEVPAGVASGSDGLTGQVTSVAGAAAADVLVVPVVGEEGVELHTVSVADGDVEVSPVLALDMTRPLADVRFAGAPSTRVGTGLEVLAAALQTGAALLASEQLGLAQWCFETTLAYAKERKQFGRAIGSYQAIKHRLADLWFEVGSMTTAARYAADTSARGDADAVTAASLAQAFCSGAAVHAAEECVQLHGGIGMTWEYPAHLFLKRAKSDQLAFGSAYKHRSRLAALVDLPVT